MTSSLILIFLSQSLSVFHFKHIAAKCNVCICFVSIQIEFDALETKKCVVFRFDWSGNQTLLILLNNYIIYMCCCK